MSAAGATSSLVVAVAPNGASKQKRDHPAIPLDLDEIVETARSCHAAGAAMLHLHVREPDGRHSLDPDLAAAAQERIRSALGDRLCIQATSESGGRYGPAQQMDAIRKLAPAGVSLALRELLPRGGGESEAALEAEAGAFFGWLRERRILPQYILYSADELRRYHELRARGVIPASPHWVLLVLGRYTGGESTPWTLLPFLRLELDVPWAVCAFGAAELSCVTCAATLGGHARVGFENNLLLRDGRRAPDNAALVAQAAQMAAALGRPLAGAAELRAMFDGWG